jgi:hypothetical protein
MPESLPLTCQGAPAVFAAGGVDRTGPRRVLGASDKSSINRIGLDISDRGSKLFTGTNPPVKILTLPEGLPGPANQPVGSYSRGDFQPAHNPRQTFMWLQNNMNVIGHDNPGKKIIAASNAFTIEKHIDKRIRDFRILQPSRPVARAIQYPVAQQKFSPGVGNKQRRHWSRESSRQPPCEKNDRILRHPMRKSSLPEHDSPRNRRQDRRRYQHRVQAIKYSHERL